MQETKKRESVSWTVSAQLDVLLDLRRREKLHGFDMGVQVRRSEFTLQLPYFRGERGDISFRDSLAGE